MKLNYVWAEKRGDHFVAWLRLPPLVNRHFLASIGVYRRSPMQGMDKRFTGVMLSLLRHNAYLGTWR